ncbi:hypothetical protein B0J12DRAFT_761831 [Macrophomina phaseolina]|uniref:Uncharacterized protein n=1 Tax=Macrophomina phaseolina TaxID=35725 RepID=A0ABQ8G1P3_9PEZI|nr:hypothetical protein B0J12DRAFT_761831 [Macrophomina phaseolina]
MRPEGGGDDDDANNINNINNINSDINEMDEMDEINEVNEINEMNEVNEIDEINKVNEINEINNTNGNIIIIIPAGGDATTSDPAAFTWGGEYQYTSFDWAPASDQWGSPDDGTVPMLPASILAGTLPLTPDPLPQPITDPARATGQSAYTRSIFRARQRSGGDERAGAYPS